MNLDDDIILVKGIGEKTSALFHKLHIEKVSDLLFLLPRGFEKYEAPVSLDSFDETKINAVSGCIYAGSMRIKKTGRYTLSTVAINCGGQSVELRFFNMPYLKKVLLPGQQYVFRGIIEKTKQNQYKMLQPKIWKQAEYEKIVNTLQAAYPLTKGLTNHCIRKTTSTILQSVVFPEDYMEESECNQMSILPLSDAIGKIHFPKDETAFYQARKRLAFHEFFAFLFEMRRNKEHVVSLPFPNPMVEVADTKRLIEALPYHLTDSQTEVWQDICRDMEKDVSMNRLIQGDVGCGKTILAFLSLLMCAANGRQGCLMAPTEVLAKQHYEGLKDMCKKYHLCMNPVLLLGSMKAADKKEIRQGIADGTYNVIIGTHAIIQDAVKYENLALVITDEQHRFGVKQREKLAHKGENPHILVMSATPIPRTLAMILYGDLSVSNITQMPEGRIPIKNCIVDRSYRESAYQFMEKEMEQGRQVYIICPMVESVDEEDELENVIDYTMKLRSRFKEKYEIAYIHGKMSLSEKSNIMDAFANHNIDILVSTTVIEVGINVPNATVMMIENAERYGLAQLHQLRGRVGRGKEQSYCIFMSNQKSPKTMDRLQILQDSNDGFVIAKKDLELRGPGELSGIRQSGELGFKIADIYDDNDMLVLADQYVNQLLSNKEESIIMEKWNKLSAFQSLFTVDFRTI